MNDDEKGNLLSKLISSDEGRQRLAHAMVGSKTPFVFVPSPKLSREESEARFQRSMADHFRRQGDTFTANMYDRAAASWEQYAKKSSVLKILDKIINKLLGAK